MTQFCCWPNLTKGTACSGCGYILKRDYDIAPNRICSTPKQCPHFMGATLETVLVFGCGCAADRGNGVPVTVCECELHCRCILFDRGTHLSDEAVRRCATCADNPATAPAAG